MTLVVRPDLSRRTALSKSEISTGEWCGIQGYYSRVEPRPDGSHLRNGTRGGCGVKRIQRQRTKGWRMPENAVYVGRPSKWENPFRARTLGQQGAVDAFVVHISAYFGWQARMAARAFFPLPVESRAFDDWIGPLRGKDLACWCPLDVPCHADVLLELAAIYGTEPVEVVG